MYIVPLMVAIMTSKWVGDAFVKEGMYPVLTVEDCLQVMIHSCQSRSIISE